MKNLITWSICILFSLNLLAQEVDEGKGPLSDAAQAMREKRYKDAEEIYRAMLRKAPDDISVKQLLCHALIYEKKFVQADSILRVLVEADSNNAGNYWYMGMSAERQGKDTTAVGCYKYYLMKTENLRGQKVKAWLYVGSAYRRMMHGIGLTQTQFDDMLYHYNTYLQLNPYDTYAGELKQFIEKVTPKRPAEGAVLVWDESN